MYPSAGLDRKAVVVIMRGIAKNIINTLMLSV